MTAEMALTMLTVLAVIKDSLSLVNGENVSSITESLTTSSI